MWKITLTPLCFLLLICKIQNSFAVEAGTIIPLYVYPRTNSGGNAWQPLLDAHRAHPIYTWAIVNVFNGPGGASDANFVKSIRELRSAGINTLGYVYTRYGARSTTQVKADINKWKTLYNPQGIFFDEMAYDNNSVHYKYYDDLNKYARSQGFTFTVGNPGTRTIPKYFDTVDTIVIFETDTGFPNKDLICSQNTNGNGVESVSVLAYNIPTLNTSAVNEVKSCAGFIYVTDDSGANPWDTLPKYLDQLFKSLQG